jgi:hypothetical protein
LARPRQSRVRRWTPTTSPGASAPASDGQILAIPEWGLPPPAPSTSALSVFPVGTVIVDITVPGTQNIVWRGAVRREVNFERSDRQRTEVIEKAIRDRPKQFPAKN